MLIVLFVHASINALIIDDSHEVKFICNPYQKSCVLPLFQYESYSNDSAHDMIVSIGEL